MHGVMMQAARPLQVSPLQSVTGRHCDVQRKLQGMYEAYYEGSPLRRTPPIPTAFVDTPGTKPGAVGLRWPGVLSCLASSSG